jgi:DNA primase
MSSAAETIKDRLGIVEVLSSYIKVEKAGANYKARCPFHNEKTPSFFISPGRNTYYCFGCQAKGDIFTFVQEFEKVDFIGALKLLAERAGVELEQFRNENKNKGELDRLRDVLEMSTVFYENQLSKNPKALEYLKSRGLTEKSIKEWRIGFAPDEWRAVHDYLISKKVSESDMAAVGLIKRSEKEAGKADTIYDRFRSRVMFPLFDPSSRVIGYSGRIFGAEENKGAGDQGNAPKYLNSPDTVLFNKSVTLYGYNKASSGIRQWKYAILVEGQMDLILSHQNGFTNTVATSGTALTHSHLEKLKRLSDNIMLVYDADRAGLKATLRAWTSALGLGMDVKVAGLPQGEDPASLLLKNKEEFKDALKNSKHIIEYYLDILSREHSSDEIKFKKAVQAELLPYVASIDSAIERSNFISKVSIQTGISETDLRTETDKLIAAGEANKNEYRTEGESPSLAVNSSGPKQGGIVVDPTERRIAALIVWFRSKQNNEQADTLTSKTMEVLEEADAKKFEDYLATARDELLFEGEVLFAGSGKLEQEGEDLLYGLEENALKGRLAKTMVALQIAERKKDKAKTEELASICQDISLKLSALNAKRRE